jgi:hypothetical protein
MHCLLLGGLARRTYRNDWHVLYEHVGWFCPVPSKSYPGNVMELHTVVNKCLITRKIYSVRVNIDDYMNWRNGSLLAQQAFPYLSAGDREFLISGISPEGWDQMYSDDQITDSQPKE